MANSPELMDLDYLIRSCEEESGKFFRDEDSDDRYCFELFRRALKLNSKYAWEAIWNNYRNLVSGWIRKSSGFDQANTSIDEMVTLSFEKFWHAMSVRDREAFDRFSSLQSILQYLRLCCASSVTDQLRRQKQQQQLTDLDSAYYLASEEKLEREVINEEERTQFWLEVRSLLKDDQEMLLVHCYFVMGLKPRQIQEQYPESFVDVNEVYRVKRNVMNRFRRLGHLDTKG